MRVRTLLLGLVASSLLGSGLVLAEPTMAAPSREVLTVAQFNVCKWSCEAPAPRWEERRHRVARVISESGADVLGINEATDWRVTGARTQWEDIQALVAPAGYVAPVLDVEECLKGGSCDHTAKLLYRTSTVSEVEFGSGVPSAGSTTLGGIAAGLDPSSAAREVRWAYLQRRDDARPFLAIAVHMDNDKTAVHEASRRRAAAALGEWAERMNAERGIPQAPTVLMADLNSNSFSNPKGPQAVLSRTGWVDAWTAPVRINASYSTINLHSSNLQHNGFPPRPVRYSGDASRIDYIFSRGFRPLEYEVVMYLSRGGAFIPRYQASDHQMIRAVLAYPR